MKKQLLKYSVIVLMTLCPSLLYAQQSSVIANYNDINQLEYNEEILRSVDLKLRFQVGIGIGQNRLEGGIKECHWKDYTMNGFVPQFGAGVDISFPRYSRNWSLQALVLFSRWDMSGEYYDKRRDYNMETKFGYVNIETQVGVTYSCLPKAKFSPILRGGVLVDSPSLVTRSNLDFDYDNDSVTFSNLGLYTGVGIDIALKNYELRLSADYQWSHSLFYGVYNSSLMFNVGITL